MRNLLGEKIYFLLKDVNVITEIRLRLFSPILVKTFDNYYHRDFIPNENLLQEIVKNATKNSSYAYEDEISSGYIHYKGGIRIGVCGRGSIRQNGKMSLPLVTSLCVRIPHEVLGVADKLGDFYTDFENTLIISPPYCGKTTLIRDMARILSDKYDTLLIDEREELFPINGSFSMGDRADILQGIPKEFVYENVVRSMAPQIVVCDEIFSEKDHIAIKMLTRSGISCLASFHANSFDDVPETLKSIFRRFVFLSDKPKVGTVRSVRRRDDT